MSERTERFVRELVAATPAVQPLLAEHEKDNGELLSHVFFGDVTRYVLSLHSEAQRGSQSAEATLAGILAVLDDGLRANDLHLRDLIFSSFLENLERTDPEFESLRARLPVSVRLALDSQTTSFNHVGQRRRRRPQMSYCMVRGHGTRR